MQEMFYEIVETQYRSVHPKFDMSIYEVSCAKYPQLAKICVKKDEKGEKLNNYIENLESNIRELQIELSKAPQINEAKNLNDSHISCKTAEVAKYNHRQIIENLNYVSIKQNTDSYNSPSKKTNNLEFDATTIKKKTYSQKSLEDSPHKKKHSKIRFNLESNDNLMSIDINEYNEMDSRGRDQYSINTYDNNNNRDFEILKMNYNDKCSELELLKKSFVELKEQYENEFEMMASSIYSLGIQFLNVKQDYAKKSQDNPNWLTRQRLKMFNGDM